MKNYSLRKEAGKFERELSERVKAIGERERAKGKVRAHAPVTIRHDPSIVRKP